MEELVLQLVDYSKLFGVQIDASDFAMEGKLNQIQEGYLVLHVS